MAKSKTSFWRNTQNFLMFGRANARLISNIRHALEEVQDNTSYELTAIDYKENKSLKKIRKAISKDANQLRLNDDHELALKVIDIAQNLGITSPQIEAGQAKSLTALNEHEKAIQIWKKQTSCNKLKIKNEANNAIKHYEQNHYFATELLKALRSIMGSENTEPKHLPESAPYDLATLEYPIIHEAIELRNDNKNELSLKVLEISAHAGLKTDLMNDNKARVLFNIGKKRDAVHIWQSLISSENEETRDSAQKILNRLSNALLHSVKEVITNHFLPTHHLPNETPKDLSKLGTCILKEAIELRKEKQESLSLEILELTTSAGFETDSINENKARVLINLNRSAEAVKLLEELRSSKKQDIQESAVRILQLLGKNLLVRLNEMLPKNDWKIRYLPDNNQQIIQELENAILKEAIELRKAKKDELSLKVLDITVKAGLQSERIEDNRARALVNMKRYSEAVAIWHSLSESVNARMQETANLMLERFGSKGNQQKILSEVDNALSCDNDQKHAISLLTSAILQNPSDQKLHEKLGQVAMMSENNNNDEQFEELTVYRQSLAGFEAFITALEQQGTAAHKSTNITKGTRAIMRIN